MNERVLSTRRDPDGRKLRRYERDDGSRHTTIEIPLPLWEKIRRRRAPSGAGVALVVEQQERLASREAAYRQVMQLLKQGFKPLAIESITKVPTPTVQRWAQAAREGRKVVPRHQGTPSRKKSLSGPPGPVAGHPDVEPT